MNKKSWIVFGLLVVGAITWMATRPASSPISLEGVNKDVILRASDQNGQIADHILGDPEAKVVIIEYGDYQCPACASEWPKLEAVVQSYESGVALVYRHFPLPGHTNAKAAAGAAESAGLQGKFWEMHSRLLATYQTWGENIQGRDAIFEGYAQELGLDIAQYKKDIASKAVSQRINFGVALGKAHNLTETPTIIVNGQKLDSDTWSDSDKLKQLIDSKL